jgi:uncharacterized protein YbaR (Trm112 family)
VMACPTCDHTMQRISEAEKVFWCPRCGTLKCHIVEDRFNDEPPMLVSRCRRFGQSLGPSWAQLWWTLGIAEAIDTPGRSEPS